MLAPDRTARRPAPSDFSFRSERLALDFAATLMYRNGPDSPSELLDSPVRLAQWVRQAGVLSIVRSVTSADLDAAIKLREAIYRAATARIGGARTARGDLAVLNRCGRASPPVTALALDGTITRTGSIRAALSVVARDAIELLGGPDAPRLRECGRDGCTRMFIDRSRGQNRTWCGMAQCGNRVNAAAYRSRRRAHSRSE
jgi:predicted RNA-binding Zn ribbon-like protein